MPPKTSPSLYEYEPAPRAKPNGDGIDARMARRDLEQALAAEDVVAMDKAIRKGRKSGWSEQEIADANKKREDLQVKKVRDERRRREREAAVTPVTSGTTSTATPPAKEKEPSREKPSIKARPAPEPKAPTGVTASEEEQELILSKLQIAIGKKNVTGLEEAIENMVSAGMDQSDEHKAKIKKAREVLKKLQEAAQVTSQRRAARKERRWDPVLGEALNFDTLCDKYEELEDRRSKDELRKYYATLQIQE